MKIKIEGENNVGYEVTYKYHERKDGVYDKEETKSLKKKVGDPFDDIPLEKLAGAVMAQLARRDIFVIEVEIVELSKKPISFKETNGGVVIKNKKFLFDQSSNLIVQDVQDVAEVSQIQNTAVEQPHNLVHNNGSPNLGRPIDFVVFAPELPQMPEVKKKGLRLTPEKKYPVYAREHIGITTALKIVDDLGREQMISDVYFVPANIRLLADNQLKFSETQKERDGGRLNWGNAVESDDMPVIRR